MIPIIREQLRARTDETVTFIKIEQVRGYQSFRDHLLQIYFSRLDIVLRERPDRPDIHRRVRSILAALEAVADDEPIYTWEVITPTRTFGGFSAASRLVLFNPDIFPDKRHPNDLGV